MESMPTTDNIGYTATSLRLSVQTLTAYRDAAARSERNASDIMREALKLWLIRENLEAPMAMCIGDRSKTVRRGGELYIAADCEIVLTGE